MTLSETRAIVKKVEFGSELYLQLRKTEHWKWHKEWFMHQSQCTWDNIKRRYYAGKKD